MNKHLIIIIISILVLFRVSSTPFSDGLELFEKNKVAESVEFFEEALITSPTEDVYKYLAECYNILELHDDEALVLEEAVSSNLGDQSYFNFKLGNAYYLISDYKNALDSYLRVLELNNGFVNETFLNIANVSVELQLYSSAIDNYTKYLELEPNSLQKRKIIRMIFLLKKEYKEQLNQIELDQKLVHENLTASEIDSTKSDEERLEQELKINDLESEREAKARELEEQRLLYENAERALLEDIEDFEIAEEKVINPPDPDIEAQRKLLQLREEELNDREAKLALAEQALKDAEAELARSREELLESNVQAPSNMEYTDSNRVKTQEELELEEAERLELLERKRQEAVMSDILQSLEKIGENAKGINASSEDAYDELEGSSIDE